MIAKLEWTQRDLNFTSLTKYIVLHAKETNNGMIIFQLRPAYLLVSYLLVYANRRYM